MFTKRMFTSATNAPFTVPEKVIVQRVGAFRGGLVGFLLGLSSASALCYVYLLEEYQQSSNSLLTNIEDLQTTTIKVILFSQKLRDYTAKIDRIEQDLKRFPSKFVTKEDMQLVRNELLKNIVCFCS
jgi:hypothetical protein